MMPARRWIRSALSQALTESSVRRMMSQDGAKSGIQEVANSLLGVPLANPLDVAVGPNGTLWVAEIGGNEITVLAPSTLTILDDVDSDTDGIENKFRSISA